MTQMTTQCFIGEAGQPAWIPLEGDCLVEWRPNIVEISGHLSEDDKESLGEPLTDSNGNEYYSVSLLIKSGPYVHFDGDVFVRLLQGCEFSASPHQSLRPLEIR